MTERFNMNQAQQQWLTKLGVATNKHIAFEAKDTRKRELLRSAAAQIESAKDEIRRATTYAIADKGKLTYSMTETSEQLDELSLREAEQRLNEEERAHIEEQRKKLAAAAENLRVKLKQAGFNDLEINETITEELYFPLVREKLMPEDLVPDQYSKTQQMLDATNTLYEEALDLNPIKEADGFAKANKGIGYAATIGKGISDLLPEGLTKQAESLITLFGYTQEVSVNHKIDLTQYALKAGVATAEAISKDKVSLDPVRGALVQTGDALAQAGDALAGDWQVQSNLRTAARTVQGAFEDVGEFLSEKLGLGKGIATGVVYSAAEQGEINEAAVNAIEGIGAILQSSLSAYAPPKIAKAVAAAYTYTTSPDLVANYLIEGRYAKAIETMGNGFASAMELCSTDQKCVKVGKAMADIFNAGVATAQLNEAIESGDYDKAMNLLTAGGQSAANGSIVRSGEALRVLFTKDGAAQKMQDKLEDQRKADVEDQVTRETAAFERMLTLVDEGGEEAANARAIETLIDQMNFHKKIMERAVSVLSGGFEAAASLVPALAIGGAAVKMVASLTAAAKCAMAINKWLDNQMDAKSAASVYSSSITNFITNQREQISYYAIKAALELAQIIGRSLSASGIGAVVGEPLDKAAALALSVADIAKEFYDEAMLQRAWSTTKAALADRKNRKLGLLARTQNPTLAKYSIAWGAVVKKDAIAKKAMDSCGLNAATLAQKDTNVGLVVKYLETQFPDDRVIRKALPKTAEWQPAEVTLTVKCWVTAKLGGERHANLAKADTGAIEGSLVTVAGLEARAAKAQKEKTLSVPLLDDFETERNRLESAFGSYVPVIRNGGPHTDMQDVVERFVALTKITKATIIEMRGDLVRASGQPSGQGTPVEGGVPIAPRLPPEEERRPTTRSRR